MKKLLIAFGLILSMGVAAIAAPLTNNRLPKAAAGNRTADSIIYDDGSFVGVGTDAPTAKLEVKAGGIKGELVNKTWEVIDQGTYGFDTAAVFGEVSAMMVRDGLLWLGYDQDTNTASTALVYRWDGNTMSYLHNFGHGADYGAVQFLIDYKGLVYAGLAGDTAGEGDVYVLDETDTSWQLLFNNKSSTVTVPNSTAHNALSGATSFSVEWKGQIQGAGENSAGRIVDKTNATSATVGYQFSTNSSKQVVFSMGEGGTAKTTTTSTTISYGVPVHLVATWASGAAPKIYINGVEASYTSSTAVTTPGDDTANLLTIGQRSGNTDRTFHGFMSRLRIYKNTELSAANVTTLYGNGTVAGATAEYLFTDGTGTTLTDSSGNSNNGTITSCLWDASHWSISLDQASSQFAYSAAIFNGVLYVGSGYNQPGEIYAFDGSTWTTAYAGQADSGLNVSLKVYQGRLFAATGGTVSYILSTSDGTTWTTEMSTSGYTEFNHFEEHRGKLYVNVIGSSNDILVRDNITGTWSVSITDLPGSQCWGMNSYNDAMYIGCSRSPNGASIFKTYDGVNYTEDVQFNTSGTNIDWEAFKSIQYNGSLYMGTGSSNATDANLWRKTDSVGQRFDLANKFLNRFRLNTSSTFLYGNDESSVGFSSPIWFDTKVGIGNTPASATTLLNINDTRKSTLDNSSYAGVDEAFDNTYEAIKFTTGTVAPPAGGVICTQMKTSATLKNGAQQFSIQIYTDSAGSPGSAVGGSGTAFHKWGYLSTSYKDTCVSVEATLAASTSYWMVIRKNQNENGGTISLNSAASGTNTHAYSSNGSAWTTESSKDGYIKFTESTPLGQTIVFNTPANSVGLKATSYTNTAISATSTLQNAISGTSTSNGQGGLFTGHFGNGAFVQSNYGNALFAQALQGPTINTSQTGSLVDNTNAPSAYFLRSSTLGSFLHTGPIIRAESKVADTGDLLQLIKQNNPKLTVASTGKTMINGTGGLIVTDSSSLGSEKVTNGTFTGNATGWTLGSGWSYSSNNVIHATGSTADLSQNVSAVAGEVYLVTITVGTGTGTVNRTGTYTVNLGGTQFGKYDDTKGTGAYFPTTYNYIGKAVSTADLIITPDTDFNGTVDTISVKKITDGDIEAVGTVQAGGITVPSLVSCDTIDTDANGVFACGTDDGAGGGAPTDATYITQTAHASLSAEQALSSLSSGIMRVENGTGVITSLGEPLPVANGGTGASSASITAFNNITGLSAAGTTGTTSTNLVFSASPTFTGTASFGTIQTNSSATQITNNTFTGSAGNTSGNAFSCSNNSFTTGACFSGASSSSGFTGSGLIRSVYSGTGSGEAARFSITNASASGVALRVVNDGTGNSFQVDDATSDTSPFIVEADGDVVTGGTVTSTATSDLGWSIQSAANQACNTTCTSACVHGWDTDVTEVAVSCSDATADKCLCAGAS